MAYVKTWKLNRNLMAGPKTYMMGSLHVEGRMLPDIELEFDENPHYFEHVSTIEEPDPEPVVDTSKKAPKRLKKKVVKEK